MEEVIENEVVYGSQDESVQGVMSERVQSLAASIYREFEKMIKLYDEDVVKELMPLVVSLLEGLDQEVSENQECKVELELLKDDNEQLITQYEREKQLRRQAEQKYLEYEDVNDQEKRALQSRLEAAEMNQKQQTLKLKNYTDQIARHEYRELDMKKEYQTLQKRHNEVLQKYMEYVDRIKLSGHNDTQGTPRLNIPRNVPSDFLEDGPESLPHEGNDHQSLSTPTTPVRELPGAVGKSNKANLQQEMISSSTSPDKSIGTSMAPQTNTETQATVDTVHAETVMTPIDNRNLSPEMAELVANTPELAGLSKRAERPSDLPNLQSVKQPNIFDELGPETAAELDDSFNITVDPSEFSDSDDSDSTFEGLSTPLTGMGKEVENILMENSELRATKNALSVVKDDLIAKVDQLTAEAELLKQELHHSQVAKKKLGERITELEADVKKVREESEKMKEVEDDDGVPMAQRKRFTRVEMARVLMERNQYKERLMELQEAVRWTEMIRASREHPSFEGKKTRSGIWKLFSSLFSSNNAPPRRPLPQGNVRYNAPKGSVAPHGKQRSTTVASLEQKSKVFDFLDDGPGQRARIRQDQYSKVKAHVRKDDGRVQAYGWSLPAKNPSPSKNANQQPESSRSAMMGVPVPIYCRPLFEKEAGTKIWCAAGVNLSGGRTRDGGSIVGASVFYSSSTEELEGSGDKNKDASELGKLDEEITQQQLQLEKNRKSQLSSYVWILTSNQNTSKVTVVDANQPQTILSTFRVSNQNIISIASVPGAMESDYPTTENIAATAESGDDTTSVSSTDSSFGNVTLVSASIPATPRSLTPTSDRDLFSFKKHRQNWTLVFADLTENSDFKAEVGEANVKHDITSVNEAERVLTSAATAAPLPDTVGMEGVVRESTLSKSDSGASSDADSTGDPLGATTDPIPTETIVSRPRTSTVETPSDLLKDGLSTAPEEAELMHEEADKKSTVMPTMWMGAQNGNLYIHSAVSRWKRCLHAVKLKDSILEIVHIKGRVMAALADGSVAVFHRTEDGQWDFANYHLLDLGRPQHSLRCMTIAGQKIWCGIRNKIHIINPETLKVEKSFDAHPRKESQVRLMAWQGDGVWVSIRLDSTLRLYHAHTCQHLQDVDIEPYVSKMLGTGKLGFSFVRITSLLIACNRLWVGTSNGVIISIPLTETKKPISSGGSKPGGVIRVYSDAKSDSVRAGTIIPYCSITQAQLSFHGHRDNVKFFVAVPGGIERETISQGVDVASSPEHLKSKNMLVLSGGEGYVDFRAGDGEDDEDSSSSSSYGDGLVNSSRAARSERSHLIVWQVSGVSE